MPRAAITTQGMARSLSERASFEARMGIKATMVVRTVPVMGAMVFLMER